MDNALLIKTFAYRAVSIATTCAVAWAVTGSLSIAGTIGVLDFAGKSLMYYLFETAWHRRKYVRRS